MIANKIQVINLVCIKESNMANPTYFPFYILINAPNISYAQYIFHILDNKEYLQQPLQHRQYRKQMKSYLQLNIESPFNKNYYRTRRNKLQITKQNQETQYTFDNICYSSQDVNSSIVYDIVIDYSDGQAGKGMPGGSTASIQDKDRNKCKPQSIMDSKPQPQPQHRRRNSCSSLSNLSATLIDQDFKEPAYNYTILYDQITQTKQVQSLIRQLSCTQIFKKQKIRIGHFIAHENGIYDFHRKRIHLTDTQRNELQKQSKKLSNISIQDNFMWIYNKQINLCEQIKLNNIEHLIKSISYISIKQFNQLLEPTLGVQLVANITKAEEIKHKELQNKKIMEIFVITIGKDIRVNVVMMHYNRNYQFGSQEMKEIQQLFMMYGVACGKIKYQTIKAQILNNLMKNISKLYYVMYFPGPKLSAQQSNICYLRKSSLMNSPSMQVSPRKQSTQSNIKQSRLKQSYLRDSYLKNSTITNHNKYDITLQNSRLINSSKSNRMSNSPEKIENRINQLLRSTFGNYLSIKNKDKQNLQRIIKQYLLKKQDNLKGELEKIKERVRELKLSQRKEQSEVSEMKVKCMKALQKMSISIIQLQKLGITNVQRHIDWLKLTVDDKKQQIKQTQQQIQQINKKTIQNRKSHEYFCKKMQQFRGRLQQKYNEVRKTEQKEKTNKMETQQKEQKQNNMKNHKSYLNILSLSQLEELEQHKDKLKGKLVEKLKNSQEKKKFSDALAEIRGKVSKLELTRLEQKYFDLLHD